VCLIVCDLETSKRGGLCPILAVASQKNKSLSHNCCGVPKTEEDCFRDLTLLTRMRRKMANKLILGYTNFPKTKDPSQSTSRQKGDMKCPTEDLKILGASVKNLFATATRNLGVVHLWTNMCSNDHDLGLCPLL
jgi:uncharacterized protein YchJ